MHTSRVDPTSPPVSAFPIIQPPQDGVAPAPIALCNCVGCTEVAASTYFWEWGEKGTCCAKCQVTLQQAAGNIARQIQFAPIVQGGSPPVERAERVALLTRAFAAEAELEESKSRGLDLYRQNVLQAGQIQSLTVRLKEADAQVLFAREKEATLTADLRAKEAELGEAVEELTRLKVLVSVPALDVAQLAKANEAQAKQITQLKQTVTTVHGQSDGLRDQVAKLRTRDGQLETSERTCHELDHKVKELTADLAASVANEKKLIAEVDRLITEQATLVSAKPKK